MAFELLQNMESGHIKAKKKDLSWILHGHSQSRYRECMDASLINVEGGCQYVRD